MKESLSYTMLLNMMLIFIVIFAAFISWSIIYNRAFKNNQLIVLAIEKYEGYNDLAKADIRKALTNNAYTTGTTTCKVREGKTPITVNEPSFTYCIYELEKSTYKQYGIVTYLSINLPVVSRLVNIPIYAKTDRTYNFG